MLAKARVVILCLIMIGQVAINGKAFGDENRTGVSPQRDALHQVSGMVMLDYSRLTLSNGGAFDLLGVHYLQRANGWLYFGVGAIAPMVEGNYGGFFAADATLHAQRRIHGNWFVNAGLAIGAGAGGASVSNIRRLSGAGLYGRAYA